MTYSTVTPRAPRPWRRSAIAAVLLAGTTLGGFAVGHAGFAAPEATPGTPVNPPGASMSAHNLPDFTALVTQVKPAVVSITTKMNVSAAEDEDQAQMPMPFLAFPFGGRQWSARTCGGGPGLGLHRRCQRHDRHQQPRGEGRQDRLRHAGRRHRSAGQGARHAIRAPTSRC